MICTIHEQLPDWSHQTVVHCYQLDLHSENDLQIQVKQLLLDNTYLSKVVDGKKSWFIRMEVLDLIYHQLFFAANILGCQPMTSHYMEPLTPQTLGQAAAAIYCMLSDKASGKMARVMFSHNEYRCTFCASTVINFTLEPTAHINHSVMGRSIPPLWENSVGIGTSQLRLTAINFIPHSIPPFLSISVCAESSLPPTSIPHSELSLVY